MQQDKQDGRCDDGNTDALVGMQVLFGMVSV